MTISNPLWLIILSLDEFSFQIKEGSISIVTIRYRQLEQTNLTAGKCNQKNYFAISTLL
jgi:hypothetical protein